MQVGTKFYRTDLMNPAPKFGKYHLWRDACLRMRGNVGGSVSIKIGLALWQPCYARPLAAALQVYRTIRNLAGN